MTTMREGWALVWLLGRFKRPFLDLASASTLRAQAVSKMAGPHATPKWIAELKRRRRAGAVYPAKVVLLLRDDYDAMVAELEKLREQSRLR